MAESVEMEHFIGFNSILNGAIFHPNGQKYVFSNGANLIIGDLIDTHSQEFLRNHDDSVTCVALSPSGRLIASGQKGDNADVYVWDYNSRKAIYKFEEHDNMVQGVAFSDDEKILASIGGPEDGNLIVWDMSNGES
jgi:WD40 repeat protein